MSRVFGLMLALLALAAIVPASPARAAGEGVISGQVVNKTAGGSPVGALEVTLRVYSNGTATDSQQTTIVDATSRFEFKGLSTDPGTTYTVGAAFQDVDYTSPVITLTATSPAQTVGLDVYDSTSSDENIRVSNGHIVVFADQGALQVLEVWRFNNISNRTFIGTKGKNARTTLQFSLPAGATSLTPGQGALETTATGATSTAAVLPGATDINFTYFIPYPGTSLAISRKTDYPIADFHLLVQDTGVKVTSTALTAAGPQNINGTSYLDFKAGNLARGLDLDATFSGIIVPSAASSGTPSAWPWLLAGIGLLGVMVVVAYPRLKKRQLRAVSPASPDTALSAPPTPDEKDALLRELARLDDAYEAGTLAEEQYRVSRARVKSSLREIYAHARRR